MTIAVDNRRAPLRMLITATIGDELMLLNAADEAGIKFEIGGPPEYDGFIDGLVRKPVGEARSRSDWFVCYFIGKQADINMAVRLFLRARDYGDNVSASHSANETDAAAFRDWFTLNFDNLVAESATSGASRELDFDWDRFVGAAYDKHLSAALAVG